MRVLRIPDEEKAKGMMWVIYPVITELSRHVAMTAFSPCFPKEAEGVFYPEIIGYVELQIKQGQN
ncbi:hypothetical protein ES703_108887 [subsurface metagenome]